jgi:hypothetical protein
LMVFSRIPNTLSVGLPQIQAAENLNQIYAIIA